MYRWAGYSRPNGTFMRGHRHLNRAAPVHAARVMPPGQRPAFDRGRRTRYGEASGGAGTVHADRRDHRRDDRGQDCREEAGHSRSHRPGHPRRARQPHPASAEHRAVTQPRPARLPAAACLQRGVLLRPQGDQGERGAADRAGHRRDRADHRRGRLGDPADPAGPPLGGGPRVRRRRGAYRCRRGHLRAEPPGRAAAHRHHRGRREPDQRRGGADRLRPRRRGDGAPVHLRSWHRPAGGGRRGRHRLRACPRRGDRAGQAVRQGSLDPDHDLGDHAVPRVLSRRAARRLRRARHRGDRRLPRHPYGGHAPARVTGQRRPLLAHACLPARVGAVRAPRSRAAHGGGSPVGFLLGRLAGRRGSRRGGRGPRGQDGLGADLLAAVQVPARPVFPPTCATRGGSGSSSAGAACAARSPWRSR